MIAALGFLDLHLRELHAVEQVAGEFPAGPRDFRAWAGVAAHHAQNPKAREHDKHEQQ
jgi:hypothetical protein